MILYVIYDRTSLFSEEKNDRNANTLMHFLGLLKFKFLIELEKSLSSLLSKISITRITNNVYRTM